MKYLPRRCFSASLRSALQPERSMALAVNSILQKNSGRHVAVRLNCRDEIDVRMFHPMVGKVREEMRFNGCAQGTME
jgi:hypothetical protein